jgi:predicted membrane channel-forming protein YqfA (hemolysin III family)
MKMRTVFLVGMTVLAVALALFLPAMPQPLAYHDFADKRQVYGIENFLDVVSNLAFMLVGLAGLILVLRPSTCFERPVERWPYLVFAIGVLLTAAGSCYYHLEPTNETLFWDRLPMTISFMSLIAAQIVDRVNVRAGLFALVPMLVVGVASVVYWILTEQAGRGNVMPYAVLQAYSVIVLLQLAALHPSRYSYGNAIYAVFAGYVLAKGFEHFDLEIFELTGAVSGHTLKHVAAGLAGLPVVYILWRRELVVGTSGSPARGPADLDQILSWTDPKKARIIPTRTLIKETIGSAPGPHSSMMAIKSDFRYRALPRSMAIKACISSPRNLMDSPKSWNPLNDRLPTRVSQDMLASVLRAPLRSGTASARFINRRTPSGNSAMLSCWPWARAMALSPRRNVSRVLSHSRMPRSWNVICVIPACCEKSRKKALGSERSAADCQGPDIERRKVVAPCFSMCKDALAP